MTDRRRLELMVEAKRRGLSVPGVSPEPAPSFENGAREAIVQGATLGFSDEIESVIAATVAAPFVSDRTFRQLITEARDSIRADQDKFAKENPALSTGLEIAGGVATGGASLLRTTTTKGAAAVGGALGAIGGAGTADADEFLSLKTATNAAIGTGVGAAVGAAFPAFVDRISKEIARRAGKPTLTVMDDSGQFTDDAISELRRMVDAGEATEGEIDDIIRSAGMKEGVFTPEQAERFNLFQRRNVTPTRANVTQSADDFAAQQSALKRSGPVADTVANQDAQLIDLASEGVDRISQRASSLPETNANVFAAVDSIVTEADEAVAAAYRLARQEAQGQPRITLEKLTKALSDNRGSENVSGGVISSLRGILKNKGVLRAGRDIDVNKRGVRTAGDDTRKLTVAEAEEIRQGLNGLFDSVTPQGRRLIRQLKNALDDDVASAVGQDVFKDARAAKQEFQRIIERGQRNKFDKTIGGFLEDVIDNKIPEEKILGKLLSGRDDDFAKFKAFLTQDAGEAGVQAWDDIRAQVLRNALDKATSTVQKAEGGQGVFNVRLFRKELNKLQNSKKYGELFNTDEQQLIADIIEIGNARIPVSSVAQGKGPTELAVNELRREVLKKIPVVGERAQELVDAVSNLRADRRLLDVTRETEAALR